MAREMQIPSMSQEDLAIRINGMGVKMNARTLDRIENGQRRVWTVELMAFGIILGVSLDWLCELTDDPTL